MGFIVGPFFIHEKYIIYYILMEGIIVIKIVEVMISAGGAMIGAFVVKKLKKKL